MGGKKSSIIDISRHSLCRDGVSGAECANASHSADVIFTDNYEGQHIVRQVRFRPIRPAPTTLDAKSMLEPDTHG
jgi:hypothetical protein